MRFAVMSSGQLENCKISRSGKKVHPSRGHSVSLAKGVPENAKANRKIDADQVRAVSAC